MLKWPNDIWYRDRKIGGILLESRAEAEGPAFIVIGIGINVTLSEEERRALAQGGVHAAALADACQSLPSRNQVAGAILDELFGMLVQFERDGITPFLAAWAELDALRDRASRVLLGERWVVGRARGVDGEGALLLEIDGQMRKFNFGEVSLRLEGEAA
jgi:BirA family biotin operon repressor/biotin-[acetyl-CoA-carboxylase] ligase